MRLVAWNCGAGFQRKAAALAALAPDIAVVSECCEPALLASKAPAFRPASALWTGEPGKKGLGVFAFGRYRLSLDASFDPTITYAIPARVSGPARVNLLALWAHHHKAPFRKAMIGPGLQAVRRCAAFLGERAAIVAGDFNNHLRWDRSGKASNHAIMVAELEGLGLVSAYHAARGEAQGAEAEATLYWRDRTEDGPRYHIDYAFVPRGAALRAVTLGPYAEWVASGLSDHVPLMVELELSAAGRAGSARRPRAGRARDAASPPRPSA